VRDEDETQRSILINRKRMVCQKRGNGQGQEEGTGDWCDHTSK
jgi:hypothetical protein